MAGDLDPDESPSGWRTIAPWEVAVLVATLVVAALVWGLFLLVNRGVVLHLR